MKKLLISVGLASILIMPQVMAQTSPAPGLTREQAVSRLTSLIPVYNVDLSVAEEDQVVTICRQVQASTLQPLRSELSQTKKTYIETVNNIDLSVRFVANALRDMSEDSSTMDLTSFHLGQEAADFRSSIDVYERILDEVLIIDCQVFPEAFVAGLEEARERKKLVEAAGVKLQRFFDGELSASFKSVQDRLERVEANR